MMTETRATGAGTYTPPANPIPPPPRHQASEPKLIVDAIRVIHASGRACPATLQRRLQIGYAAAAATLDKLEAIGVVGQRRGTEPRAIFIKTAAQSTGL